LPDNKTQAVKAPTRGQAKQIHLPRSSAIADANQINENVLYLLSFSLAAVFFELLAWLVSAVAGIEPRTVPAYIIFAIPALMAIASGSLQFIQIPFAMADLFEAGGCGLAGVYIIGGMMLTFILDAGVILLSIKLML
jgi:hypothetical protein